MFNISGIYDQDQIEHITIKYLEKKKEQNVKKQELNHLYLKSDRRCRAEIILTEGINKKRLNIFDAQKKISTVCYGRRTRLRQIFFIIKSLFQEY